MWNRKPETTLTRSRRITRGHGRVRGQKNRTLEIIEYIGANCNENAVKLKVKIHPAVTKRRDGQEDEDGPALGGEEDEEGPGSEEDEAGPGGEEAEKGPGGEEDEEGPGGGEDDDNHKILYQINRDNKIVL